MSNDFSIRVIDRATREMAGLSATARRAVMGGVLEAAYVVQRAAKLNVERNFTANKVFGAGLKAGGTTLQRSIIVLRRDAQLAAEIGPTVIYGRIRELGGTIHPVHKKFLSWWEVGPPKGIYSDVATRRTRFSMRSKKSIEANLGWAAHRVFAKKVTQKGKPYLQPALDDNHARITGAMGGVVQKWIAQGGAG